MLISPHLKKKRFLPPFFESLVEFLYLVFTFWDFEDNLKLGMKKEIGRQESVKVRVDMV